MLTDIKEWNVEDNAFWESTGRHVAYRNLWISIPCLLCGFAVWLMWGIIAVQMHNLARQVAMATVQVAQAGSPAQVQQASKILADTRKALYRILAADDEAAEQDA